MSRDEGCRAGMKGCVCRNEGCSAGMKGYVSWGKCAGLAQLSSSTEMCRAEMSARMFCRDVQGWHVC